MPDTPTRRPLSRLEAWAWTGPLGHLLGGALDLLSAWSGYLLRRVRGRLPSRNRPR